MAARRTPPQRWRRARRRGFIVDMRSALAKGVRGSAIAFDKCAVIRNFDIGRCEMALGRSRRTGRCIAPQRGRYYGCGHRAIGIYSPTPDMAGLCHIRTKQTLIGSIT